LDTSGLDGEAKAVKGDVQMQGESRKRSGMPVITVESSEECHQEVILSTITKRAYQIFEERERKHGFALDDWLNAERELWRDNDLNDPNVSLTLDYAQDPEVTTILSLTNHSLVVFQSRRKHAGEINAGPDVQSVHQFSQEIDPALAEVKLVNGTLRVCLPKKNHATSR
jgi:Protein of unknown function (DUF2934)